MFRLFRCSNFRLKVHDFRLFGCLERSLQKSESADLQRSVYHPRGCVRVLGAILLFWSLSLLR